MPNQDDYPAAAKKHLIARLTHHEGAPDERRRRKGEIIVMPAGCVDENYVAKLSRLDLEIRGHDRPLDSIFNAAREELRNGQPTLVPAGPS